jgi:hypothetical protein
MPERLIITNGDVAAARLADAGIEGEILPWRDVLHEGPVPGGLVLEALSLVRAPYLAKRFGHPLPLVNEQFANRDAMIRSHGQFERVELWFEHDLYDQLQLVQVIDFFAKEGRIANLRLIQSGDHLGGQSAEALRELGTIGRSLGAADLAEAQALWHAFTDSSPARLMRLAEGATALPYMGAALRRLFCEFPALGSGLGLTEERALTVLMSGQRAVGEIYRLTQAQESAQFLGDASFFRLLDDLALAPQPLVTSAASASYAGGPVPLTIGVSPDARIRITEAGRLAVGGKFDHAVENGIERWFGGTLVTPESLWRRDLKGQLIAPLAA